jgi:hypothetical protein
MSLRAWLSTLVLSLGGCLGELVIVDETGASDETDEACAADAVDCNGECATLASDVEHCGACGVICLPGQICVSGECETPSDACDCDEARELCVDGGCQCRAGLAECAGTCVDLRSDVSHCGECDQPCAGACVDGECVADCAAPNTLCGTSCVDLDSNPLHCEECGNSCEADEVCVAGSCRDFAFAGCDSCPCECAEAVCCESALFDAVLCVHDEACPP